MLKLPLIKSVLTQMYRNGIKKNTIQNLYRFFVKSWKCNIADLTTFNCELKRLTGIDYAGASNEDG